MALKLFLLVLLTVTAIYAAPTFEDDDNDDEIEALSDSLDEPSEDEMDDENDDEDDELNAPKSKTKKSGKPEYLPLYSKHEFCVCKKAMKAAKGDEEFSEDEPMTQEDFQEGMMELDPSLASRVKAAAKAAAKKKAKAAKEIHKLVSPFFKPSDKSCYCTKDKLVLRFFHVIKMYKVNLYRTYYYGARFNVLKHLLKKKGMLKKKSKKSDA